MSKTRTIYLDSPTDEWKSSLAEFLEGIDAPIGWADSPEDADVVIDWPDERETCEPNRLHSGGRITCPDAFKVAGRLRMDRSRMGPFLDLLEIRITDCQLGCFK